MIDYILTNWIEVLGTVIGILYLYLELKANILMWLTGIIMPAISIVVYYNAGLYADFGMNIYYFGAAVYGYLVWQFGKKKDEKYLPITLTPKRMYLRLILCFLICFIGIRFILVIYTNSTVPTCDAFTTALSIVGMWMLARKWLEQWLTWLVVDAVCCGLYIYKGIFFYAALYGIYTIIAYYGYLRWQKMMKEQ